MVRDIILLQEFAPGFVEVKNKIPKFQYRKSLGEELDQRSFTRETCIDLLECMLFISNFEEMLW